MKVIVTGINGQLGHDVMQQLKKRGHQFVGTDLTGCNEAGCRAVDITCKSSVEELISSEQPDAVIHCAAWTAVDDAEDNIEECRKINVDGTRNIAAACKEADAKMVYISTDYVFDGQGKNPWDADCRDYRPLNVYGQTKLDGELAVAELLEKYFIVRTAWVFGRNGNNFIKTMLRVGKSHDTISVVNDQIGTPTYTVDLARLLIDMVETERYGYYHATNEGGYVSWYEFACEIFRQATEAGIHDYSRLTVKPVTTAEYGLNRAARPYNSRLDRSKLATSEFQPLPTWQDAVRRFLTEDK